MSAEGEKKRLRFTYEDDIVLLREVVSRNAFRSSELWEEVKNSLFKLTNKLFTIKTIRQHLQLLLDQWTTKENKNQKSSGIEEPYSEKDVLLQEIKDLLEEEKTNKNKSKQESKKKKLNTEEGKEIRHDVAMSFYEENVASVSGDHNYVIEECISDMPHDLNDSFNIPESQIPGSSYPLAKGNTIIVEETPRETPKKKIDSKVMGTIKTRAKKTTYLRRTGLDYLKEKYKEDKEIEEKRLALEEKTLNIEERKVAVAERNVLLSEKKFEFDRENYKKMFDSQQTIISKLVEASLMATTPLMAI